MLIAITLSAAVFIAYATLILFYHRGWNAIPDLQSQSNLSTKVSIIIPARNEEQNIVSCLFSLQHQTYPKNLWEASVVDDHSTDNTWQVLQDFTYQEMRCQKIKLSDYINESDRRKAYKK